MPNEEEMQQRRDASAQVPRVAKEMRRLGLLTMGQVERSYGFVVITMSPTEAAAFADRLEQLIPIEVK